MTGKNIRIDSQTNIPLYAGCPSIKFQQLENEFYLLLKKKKLSELFLYGQTIEPISLDVKGPHHYLSALSYSILLPSKYP